MTINDELRAMRERVEANAHYEYATRSHTDRARLLDAVERVMDKTSPIIAGTGNRYRAGRRDMALEIRNLIAESLDIQ